MSRLSRTFVPVVVFEKWQTIAPFQQDRIIAFFRFPNTTAGLNVRLERHTFKTTHLGLIPIPIYMNQNEDK